MSLRPVGSVFVCVCVCLFVMVKEWCDMIA